MPTSRLLPALLASAALAASLAGCAGLGAKPWDRDLMARRSMQLNTHPLIGAAVDHIYDSREGSAGGRTYKGGGCGCS
ncbi:MAG: DUF4266 domain-containing protein [Proteobacteria bacterium]|nr:DUF4266 domain-containing protein [Pseudomonadota bacterium]